MGGEGPSPLPVAPAGLSQGFQRLPHLPGTIFIGDSGRSPGVQQGAGVVTGPSEAQQAGQWQWRRGGGHSGAAVSSSACVCGGGEGGQGARGYKYPWRASKARHLSRLRT